MPKTAGKLLALEKLVFLAGYAIVGLVISWLLLMSGVVNATLALNNADVKAGAGRAYVARANIPNTPYAFMDDRTVNAVVELWEDGQRLGPPFAPHADIQNIGAGKYSAWRALVYFSTSDNSTPTINGRIYTLRGPVAPTKRWLGGAGAALLLCAILAFTLRRIGAQGALPRLGGAGGAAFAAGVLAAFLPIANRASLDPSTLALVPYLLLLLGFALLIMPVFVFAYPNSARVPLARPAALMALAILIFVAIGTSGILQGRHHVDPHDLSQKKPNTYEYRVRGLPFDMALARDEERTLVNRTLIADPGGALLPGQPEKRIELMPGGLSSFWNRTAVVSLRNPGGAMEPSNALTMTGALRVDPNTVGILLWVVVLAVIAIGRLNRSQQPASASGQAPHSSRSLPTILAGGTLSFAALALIYLQPFSVKAPATDLGIATQLRMTHLLTVAAAVLVLALVPWRTMSFTAARKRGAAEGAILLIALLAPLLGLLDAWVAAGRINSVSMTSLHMLGSMQASDSSDYLHGALELIATGDLDHWNSRRPLTSTLLTLRVLVGAPDIATIMLLGALLISGGLMLAAREVLLVAGGWAALAFIIACGAFAAEWTPTNLSEGPGFAMGLFGHAALMAAWRRDSLPLFGLGVTVLSVGLMARAGPLLIIPAVVLAGPIIQWRAGRWRMAAWLATGIAGAALGLAHSGYLVGQLGGPLGMIQSNFSYTLYGLAVGGKGWMQILTDHPELFSGALKEPPEPRIYALAIEAIRAQPSRLIMALFEELRRVPAFFYGYFDIAAVNIWLMSGAVIVIVSFANRWAVLGLAAVVGLYASSPLIMSDGGIRVYAAAVPLMALLVAFGFDAFRRGIALMGAGAGPPELWTAIRTPAAFATASRRPPLLEPSAIGSAAIISLILAAPLAINSAVKAPTGPLATGPACDAEQSRIVMHSRAMVDLYRVKGDSEAGTLVIPDVKQRDLLNAARILGPVFEQSLARLPSPYTLKVIEHVVDPAMPSSVVRALVGWPANLPIDRSQPYLAACAVRVGETDRDNIGAAEIYEIKTASPTGFAPR